MQAILEPLATLLSYPDRETAACLDRALEACRAFSPEAAEAVAEWGGYIRETPLWEVQENYTRTFDLAPACPLDVGYYLFGEDYQRGVFMAHLREALEELGMAEEGELPDHLTVLLRWLARVHGSELYDEMTAECVVPVVQRMIALLADGTNPYRRLLQAVARVLEQELSRRGIAVAERRFPRPDLAAPVGNTVMTLEGVPIR
jgi:nitrate reductase delta subunit